MLAPVFLICFSCQAGDSMKQGIASDSLENRAGAERGRADPEVLAFLGPEILSVIEKADRMETYRIGRNRSPSGTGQEIQGYPVIEQGLDLKGKGMSPVKKMLYSASAYEFQWSKRTRIRPSYALRVIQNNKHVDIAIDFNSRQWEFSLGDMHREEDISKQAAASLNEIMNQAFGSR